MDAPPSTTATTTTVAAAPAVVAAPSAQQQPTRTSSALLWIVLLIIGIIIIVAIIIIIFIGNPFCRRPPAPTGVIAQQSGNRDVRVRWNRIPNVRSYRVYRGTDRNVSPSLFSEYKQIDLPAT